MIKAKKLGSFSLLLVAVTMASLVARNGSMISANLGVSNGAVSILAILKKQGKAKAAAF
ncbi:hypothetical protein [Bacillus pumilus]|uniref:hypothetical protein n=1 Tax=Bacillus pumilus TaxID=1408 RepID=UPI0024926DE5|nr:hypothetical protein [Bacillus pumilus]